MAPRRDGPRSARDGSWTSEDDDVVEEAELHGVALGRSASGHLNKGGGHPGGASHQTPRDETRRNMRALRKGGGGREDDTSTPRSRSRSRSRRAGPRGRGDVPEDLEPSPAPAVDPQVMRKIQSDLDKLARKKNERERAKQRRGAREAKDHDRSASRLSGAGVRENILHTPLATVSPAGAAHARRGSADLDAFGAPSAASSKRGSFASVAYSGGAGSSDEEDGGWTPGGGSGNGNGAGAGAGAGAGNRNRNGGARGGLDASAAADEEATFTNLVTRRRAPREDGGGGKPAEVADSLRYMEVMSRYLSNRGVHGSLLDELEGNRDGTGTGTDIAATATGSGAGVSGSGTPAASASPEGWTPTAKTSALAPPRAPSPSPHIRTPSPRVFFVDESVPGARVATPATPNTLSPAAAPFDGRRLSSVAPTARRSSPSLGGDARVVSPPSSFLTRAPSSEPEPDDLHSSLAASIEHMRGSGAVPRSDQMLAAAATGTGSGSPERDDDDVDDGNMSTRSVERAARLAADADRAAENVTPPPGEASTHEGAARLAARRAGTALRAALDASAGDEPLGDAQRASADLLHELEYALGMCERAVEGARRPSESSHASASVREVAAARAVVSHSRLSGVLLEEVRAGASHAAKTLKRLSAALRSSREEEAAAGEAAEEAAAAAMAEETGAAAAAAAAAETAADRATERAAAALVRAALAGAWVAQHLSVYSRWAKRASAWAGSPPPPPPARAGSQQALHELDTASRRRGAEREAAAAAADAVYTRAIYDVVVSWSGYISASAAAAPPDEEEDEEEAAYWGVVRYRSTDPAARRSFLRSLWVQAFIAQSCVQGAFSAMHTARTSADWDFQSLMNAVMRIIAVATTVENQLSEMGGGASFEDGSVMTTTTTTTTAEPSSAPLGSAPRGAPTRAEGDDAAPRPLQPRSPNRTNRESTPPETSASAAAASMDLIDALWTSVSQVRSLKFERVEKIGRGGFSTVLRATWRGSTVAVKVLDPKKINGDVVDAIKREVTVMTANRHPHIVTVLAASVQLPDASIIMEHCAQGSLSDVLARARKHPKRLCWRVRLLMACDAACGLAYLHSSSNQIAHRDINTQNLLVTEDMRVKIADFGLSRLVRTARGGAAGAENADVGNRDAFKMEADDRQAMSEGLRNCLFHAPEVIAAGADAGFGTRADVFSFGCVLWCLATLAPPWEEVQKQHEDLPEMLKFYNIMRDVAAKVTAGERLPLPGREGAAWDGSFAQADALAVTIERCFRTDPNERPSMTRVLHLLRKMRRTETEAEFAAHPLPEDWRGFTPAGVPHMGAGGLGMGPETPPTPPPQSSTPPPVANFEGGGVHARRLVAVLAVVSMASFAIGRWGRGWAG